MSSLPSVHLSRERSLASDFAERSLTTRRREIARLQEQISTGYRVNRPSDDATAYAEARRMDVLIDRYEQYERTIGSARAWVDATQTALDDLADLMTEAYERGVQGQSDALSPADKEILAGRLEALRDQVFDRLNTRHDGEYLFAGTRTTEPAFSRSGTTITYEGNTDPRLRPIGPGVTLDISIDGESVVDTGAGFTITEALQDMIDALRADDAGQVATALDRLVTARDHVIARSSDAGNLGDRLNVAEAQLRSADRTAQARRSDAQDADLAEVLVNFQKEQTHLQAALQVTASVLQTSLIDYLR
ncbi:MAG: flagellar hook-associated protein 3 [Bacteroidetes bacterium]|nr:flagellar hook-associated protein 3 [Rhodothermaceae bacterium RA]RMH68211.1 MAG: flagellar hook-associated protein 3 [Bacteroidota bacterium]